MNETIRDPRRVKSEALEAVMRIWGRCGAASDAADAAHRLYKLLLDWEPER